MLEHADFALPFQIHAQRVDDVGARVTRAAMSPAQAAIGKHYPYFTGMYRDEGRRQALFKYKLHQDQELFDRAYGYVRQYY